MKKTLLITATFALLTTISYAQSPAIKFGIHAGTSIANMKYDEEEGSFSPKSLVGIQAGLVADLQLGKHISLQPGVNFVQKGMKSTGEVLGIDFKFVERINTIEIPVNILYNSKGNVGNFFVGAGPSFSIAVAGKYIGEVDGETEKEKMEFGNDENKHDYRSFDFGLNGIIGYEFKAGFFLAANYNIGLRNVMPGADNNDEKVKTNYIGIRVGYFFKAKR